jgi:CheY-like chemotaxis protein
MAKILIIDDDDAICKVLGKLLRANGHEVEVASDGKAGVAAAQHGVDLIICDLSMPGMGGHDVLAAVKKNPRLEEIPFVFLSGNSDRESVRHSMNLGGDDFITKPALPQEILDTVNARLKQHERRVQRRDEEVKKAVKIFAGIVNDLGDSEAAIHWLAEAAAGHAEKSSPAAAPAADHDSAFLAVRDNRRYFVKLSEIKALLADGEYSKAFWGADQSMMFRKPLKQWEQELPAGKFLRIHRNAIINLEFLEFVKRTPAGPEVHLREFSQVLEVSQRKVPLLNRTLKEAAKIH